MARVFVSLFVVLFLAGCAGVTTFHNACMEGHARFADQVACIRANVAERGMQNDTLVQEYLLTGDVLAGQVEAGQITEEQARLQFTRKLNEIRQAELEQAALQARINRAWDRPWHHPRCRHDPYHPFCWP